MRNKLVGIIFICLISLFAIACGGGGAAPLDNPQEQIQNPAPQPPVVAGDQTQNPIDDPVSDPVEKGYRAIPSIPLDKEGSHVASEVEEFFVLGKDALDFSQCEVDGDAMIINVGGVAASNLDNVPAWALYKIGGLRDKDPISLNIECYPEDIGMEYSVAVADYTLMDWRWFGPTSIPEYQILIDDEHQYVTHLGNLYFLVVGHGTNISTHHRSTVVCGVEDEMPLPGAPQGLSASKGEFEEGVEISWRAGTDAESYEVYRQDMLWMYPGYPLLPPNGDPGGNRPDPDPENPLPLDWVLIATTTETTYFDSQVEPGLIYSYKARSVNETGFSEFSNTDDGWAKEIVPPPIPGVHGYVYGANWPPEAGGFDPNTPPPGTDPADPPVPADFIPLEGATLTLTSNNRLGVMDLTFIAISDADGFYQFVGDATADGRIIPGTYTLTCELGDWTFPDVYSVMVPEGDFSLRFDFFGWQETGGGLFGIRGYVWDAGGCLPGEPGGNGGTPIRGPWPMANVPVTFVSVDTRDVVLETMTDANGFYEALDLPEGVYEFWPTWDGFYFDPPTHTAYAGPDPAATMLYDFYGYQESDPPPPDPDPVLIGLSGWVLGDNTFGSNPFERMPLPGVVVSVNGLITDEHFGTAITDSEGFFNFPELPAGEYAAHAMLEGWLFQPEVHVVILEDFPVEIMFFGTPEIGGDPGDPRPGDSGDPGPGGGDPNVPPGGDPER